MSKRSPGLFGRAIPLGFAAAIAFLSVTPLSTIENGIAQGQCIGQRIIDRVHFENGRGDMDSSRL